VAVVRPVVRAVGWTVSERELRKLGGAARLQLGHPSCRHMHLKGNLGAGAASICSSWRPAGVQALVCMCVCVRAPLHCTYLWHNWDALAYAMCICQGKNAGSASSVRAQAIFVASVFGSMGMKHANAKEACFELHARQASPP